MAAYIIHWSSANSSPELNRRVRAYQTVWSAFARVSLYPSSPSRITYSLARYRLKEQEAGDGIHPNSDGYELLADLVNSWQPWRSWFDEDQTAPSCCLAKPDVH